MATQITPLIKALQEKISAANTTNTSAIDLYYMLELSKSIDGGCTVQSYANAAAFPTASSTSNRLAFNETNRTLYFNDGSSWKSYDLTVPDAYVPTSQAQGSNYGYTSGGGASNVKNTIDNFPFASDANASSAGSLSVARYQTAGQSSSEYGYTSGGYNIPLGGKLNTIDKFPFASGGSASDVGDLSVSRLGGAGQSSTDYGYTSGGFSPPYKNTIDKFSFSSDGNATSVGGLSVSRHSSSGQSSTDYGYTSGGMDGLTAPGVGNQIDKFPFSSDTNAADVGDLSESREVTAGQSSYDYGYASSGFNGSSYSNVIDKFPFASDANATDVGDATVTRRWPAGQSSLDYGYSSGGFNPSYLNVIDKFSFSTDGNATDVGDLTVARFAAAGQQY